MTTGQSDILAGITALEVALRTARPETSADQALYQCERLRHAVRNAHAEGIRFAAYTMGRLVRTPVLAGRPDVQERFEALRAALLAGGHPF